jgi:hypothetical protein
MMNGGFDAFGRMAIRTRQPMGLPSTHPNLRGNVALTMHPSESLTVTRRPRNATISPSN